MYLNKYLYTRFHHSFALHFTMFTSPRMLQRQPMRRTEVSGLFPRKETGHLLFPYFDMKRHFYFCRPPRLAAISTVFKTLSWEYQCHCSWARFTGPGFEPIYNTDIAHSFKESLPSLPRSPQLVVLSIFRIPLLIILRAIQQVTLN